jgi:hypothetical protein
MICSKCHKSHFIAEECPYIKKASNFIEREKLVKEFDEEKIRQEEEQKALEFKIYKEQKRRNLEIGSGQYIIDEG